MRRRINGGRRNEKGLDRCMPVSAKRDRRQGLYLAYVYSNKALVFSVKGDAQAVTYVAACAIVGINFSGKGLKVSSVCNIIMT